MKTIDSVWPLLLAQTRSALAEFDTTLKTLTRGDREFLAVFDRVGELSGMWLATPQGKLLRLTEVDCDFCVTRAEGPLLISPHPRAVAAILRASY